MLVTATVVGLLTGFLGVGGGFLVVPALLLALAPAHAPTPPAPRWSSSRITSAAALAARAGVGSAPDWGVVLVLTVASALGRGRRRPARRPRRHRTLSDRASPSWCSRVAAYTAARALPALVLTSSPSLALTALTHERTSHEHHDHPPHQRPDSPTPSTPPPGFRPGPLGASASGSPTTPSSSPACGCC